MKKTNISTVLAIITIVISGIGIFSSFINDKIINKRSISITLDSELSLVNDNEILNDMEIIYKGKQIHNLYKATFIVLNDGNTSFTQSDVIEKIVIQFPSTTTILYVDKNRSIPDSLKINTIPNNDSITLDFSLLNKGDYYEFSVFYTGKQIDSFSVDGRIKDLREIKHFDKRIGQIKKPVKKANWVTWTIGITSSLFLLVLLCGLKDIVIHKRIRKELHEADMSYIVEKYNLKTRSNLVEFVNNNMGFLANSEKKNILNYIEQNDLKQALLKIETTLPIKGSLENSLLFYIIVICIGVLYFLWFLVL